MGHAYNDITGNSLRSKVANEDYLSNEFWENNYFEMKRRGEVKDYDEYLEKMKELNEDLQFELQPCGNEEPELVAGITTTDDGAELFTITEPQLAHYLTLAYSRGKIGGRRTIFEDIDMVMGQIRMMLDKD